MVYEIYQNCLLAQPDKTQIDYAAWTQAFGSIAAIITGFLVVVFQAKRTDRAAKEALGELAKATVGLQEHLVKILGTRDDVHAAGESGLPFDVALIEGLERSLNAIHVHKLPKNLVRLALILSATVTQVRIKIEMTLQLHRKMDASEFDDFFKTLQKMLESLKMTATEIEKGLDKKC